jgi:hypothetical protein
MQMYSRPARANRLHHPRRTTKSLLELLDSTGYEMECWSLSSVPKKMIVLIKRSICAVSVEVCMLFSKREKLQHFKTFCR